MCVCVCVCVCLCEIRLTAIYQCKTLCSIYTGTNGFENLNIFSYRLINGHLFLKMWDLEKWNHHQP